MAMVRCRECGAEISTEAAVCPHCGVPQPAAAAVAAGAAPGAHAQPAYRDPAYRDPAYRDPPPRRRGGRAGWMVAFLLLLVLLALFGLWYGGIVNFN